VTGLTHPEAHDRWMPAFVQFMFFSKCIYLVIVYTKSKIFPIAIVIIVGT